MGSPWRETAPHTRVYAIGDIHGRYDLLQKMMSEITAHWHRSPIKPKKTELVFLGDVIDRGPDSNKCLSFISRLVARGNAQLLLGNHEDMMHHAARGDQDAIEAWMENGGLETLSSYGIAPQQANEDSFDFATRLRGVVPDLHLRTIEGASCSYRSGDYLFVHAGLRPGISIRKQRRRDLISIRSEFTESSKWHGAVVVHGHTKVPEPQIFHNRIACDTGAYQTGKLSCVCLEGSAVSFLST